MARMSATRGGSGGKGREEGAEVAAKGVKRGRKWLAGSIWAKVTTKNTQEGRR